MPQLVALLTVSTVRSFGRSSSPSRRLIAELDASRETCWQQTIKPD
jgi:hypothetical protein